MVSTISIKLEQIWRINLLNNEKIIYFKSSSFYGICISLTINTILNTFFFQINFHGLVEIDDKIMDLENKNEWIHFHIMMDNSCFSVIDIKLHQDLSHYLWLLILRRLRGELEPNLANFRWEAGYTSWTSHQVLIAGLTHRYKQPYTHSHLGGTTLDWNVVTS